MRCRSILLAAVMMSVLSAVSIPQAFAQPVKRGDVEVSVLTGFTLLIPREGDAAQEISFPNGSGVAAGLPALRLTYWVNSQLMYDLGLSFVHVGSKSDKSDILNIEGGVGGLLGRKGSRTQPFCSALLGYLTVSSGGTASGTYLGGQIGIRQFLRDYVVGHLQLGYRSMLGNTFRFSTLELGLGLGFIL